MIEAWGRWEGADRLRQSVGIDVEAKLADGRMLAGEVKWNRKSVGPAAFTRHLEKLNRLAASGQSWAGEALAEGAEFLFVSAGGFQPASGMSATK